MANREKKNTPAITIVIGTLNRPHVVTKLLKQILAVNDIEYEILVFDQSSGENYTLLKNVFPNKNNVTLIHLDTPNTCKYLNLGWQRAKAPIVLYLDDDVILTEKTLKAHLKAYDNQSILGVAGRVINDNEPVAQTSSVGQVKFFGAVIDKNFSSLSATFVQFPYGCNMSFRKKTLEELNGFDERLEPPNYSFNEVDLGYRMSKKWSKSIVFEPEALVYHKRYPTGGTREYSGQVVAKSNALNYGYFIGKNFSLWQHVGFLVRRMPYQIVKEPENISGILEGFLKARN